MVYYDLILYSTLNSVKSQSQKTEQICNPSSLADQSPYNLWLVNQSKSFFNPLYQKTLRKMKRPWSF